MAIQKGDIVIDKNTRQEGEAIANESGNIVRVNVKGTIQAWSVFDVVPKQSPEDKD